MTNDIDEDARIAYDAGIDPIDYAERLIQVLIVITASCAASPDLSPDLSFGATARRILGCLLNAGWTPPEVPDVRP